MPRKKTIIVDDAAVLAAIVAAYTEDLAYLAEERDKSHAAADAGCDQAEKDERRREFRYFCHRLEVVKTRGIDYDLPRFAGRTLTPSERIRHQEAIRRLEAAGKVSRYGNSIKPVEAPDA